MYQPHKLQCRFVIIECHTQYNYDSVKRKTFNAIFEREVLRISELYQKFCIIFFFFKMWKLNWFFF